MNNRSFTLIELLVVIVIIGILAAVIVVSTSSAIQKANFAKAQAFSSTVQNELVSDLISEWTFDLPEVSNTTEDTWGNNNGTIYGGVDYKTKTDGVCVYGGCYSFNGTDGYIDCGNSNNLNITQEITTTAWVNLNNYLNTALILSKYQSSLYGSWYISTGGTNIKKLRYVFIDENTIYRSGESSKDLPISEWAFIGWSFDKGITKLYINGEVENFGNYNIGILSNSAPTVKIGGRPGSTFFDGLVDDVRIYNVALSSAQIKQNYVAGLDSLLASGNISKEEYQEKLSLLALN